MKSWSLNHELHFSLSLPLMIFLLLYLPRRLFSAVKNAALWVARSATRGRTNKWRADHTRLHTVKQIFLFWLRPLEHDSLSLISLSPSVVGWSANGELPACFFTSTEGSVSNCKFTCYISPFPMLKNLCLVFLD